MASPLSPAVGHVLAAARQSAIAWLADPQLREVGRECMTAYGKAGDSAIRGRIPDALCALLVAQAIERRSGIRLPSTDAAIEACRGEQ